MQLGQAGTGDEGHEGRGVKAVTMERDLEAAELAAHVLDHARSLLDKQALGFALANIRLDFCQAALTPPSNGCMISKVLVLAPRCDFFK